MAGQVVHFELPYDDGDRARAFYEQAFGWELMSPPGMEYTLVTSGPSGDEGPTEPGFINGGMAQRQGPLSSPNIVILVDNLEDALQAVTDAGGSTVEARQAVGDMGFAAYFRDPEGNVLGLWEVGAVRVTAMTTSEPGLALGAATLGATARGGAGADDEQR